MPREGFPAPRGREKLLMSSVRLVDVSDENLAEVMSLKIREDQRGFVPSISSSLEKAAQHASARPFAICTATGEVIGFAMYGIDQEKGKWKIYRLLIDERYQGSGYGTSATAALLESLSDDHNAGEVIIVYQTRNTIARKLYRKFGFVEYGTEDDKTLAAVNLKAAS